MKQRDIDQIMLIGRILLCTAIGLFYGWLGICIWLVLPTVTENLSGLLSSLEFRGWLVCVMFACIFGGVAMLLWGGQEEEKLNRKENARGSAN